MNRAIVCLFLLLVATAAAAAQSAVPAKPPKGVSWGRWMPVKLFLSPQQDREVEMQVRSLMWNGNIKEFTTGEPHDVTDRTFVVQRAYRVNDYLPQDGKKRIPKWQWQRGGWLLVDRVNGRVTQLKLPDFDPYYSIASWYRDFVAYCGISPEGDKLSLVVFQLGDKKPTLKQPAGSARQIPDPDSECGAPQWERQPMRVTFDLVGRERRAFEIKGQRAEIATAAEAEPEQDEN